MKKHFTLLLAFFVFTQLSNAQRSKTPPPAPPRPAAPKGPPPYVLKKDYEPQMADLNAKVNAASNAASSARRNMEASLHRITALDSQMSDVQAILNSANFQIAMNADSLKVTRSSIEELTAQTNEQFARAKAEAESSMQTVWIISGVLLILIVGVFLVLFNMLNKKMEQLKVMLHMSEEVLKKSLSTGHEKVQREIKEELQALESRSLQELNIIKREMTQQISSEKEKTAAGIQALSDRIEALHTKPNADTDPEIFI